MRVRPRASGTGFASWTDELALDRWRTGEVFGDDELPVLFAHGHHNQPDAMVLAATEYRRAYAGKLSRVLASMIDGWHLVWIGFSFTDQRIGGVLREVAEHSGARVDPGGPVRHVAIMAWDPDGGRDPETLRRLARIQYGADLILYPAPDGDHAALRSLLAEFTVAQYPPVEAQPTPPPRISQPVMPVRWVPAAEVVEHFTGRVEELAWLDQWVADPTIRLVGVTAWGGAGKTALVTHWIQRHGGAGARSGVRGVFGWSFYADASAERWASALLEWAEHELRVPVDGRGWLGTAVLALLQRVPLLLVLDGLEVLQEGPEGGQFGRLLDGTLREVLAGACLLEHGGLVVLTSRFAFADLETFDGGTARMLDVPPFTPAEGAALLAAAGGARLSEAQRRDLVAGVDGHALAVSVLGALLADRLPTADLVGLRDELAAATSTDTRVAWVLRFYADRLAEADRYLVAAVALFTHPITAEAILTVATHPAFGGRLAGWTPQQVQYAARHRLAGLLSCHPDGSLSAHPLVRETFRPLALGAAEVAAETTLTGLPAGTITNREDGLRVVEAIELLLDADQWQAADDLYRNRTDNGYAWQDLPAARLGQRAASAFVATPARQQHCPARLTPRRLSFYLNEVGLFAMLSGDLATAREYLNKGISHDRAAADLTSESIGLLNLAECLGYLGEIDQGLQAATHATARAAEAADRNEIRDSAAYRGRLLMLAGETAAAEEQFEAADRIWHTDNPDGDHLCGIAGAWWGMFLARTGRAGPAQRLTDRNRVISVRYGWNTDVARCDRLLGQLDLQRSDTAAAASRLATATQTFRDGDYLVELAATLPVLAECARRTGDLNAAQRYATEAITIAAPRQLRPAHAAALTVRARLAADQVTAGNPDHLQHGRDAADAAHRIATGHRLAWHELDALDAHAHLDQAEGTDHGWAIKAATQRKRLIPDDLDPDPLTTIERLVAKQGVLRGE
jgi:tetratricopeptide (TPR) repeat protein